MRTKGALLLTALLLLAVAGPGAYWPVAGGANARTAYAADAGPTALTAPPREGSYEAYMAANQDKPRPNDVVAIQAGAFTAAQGMQPKTMQNVGGASGASLWTDETGTVTWTFDVKLAGLYNMAVDYYPIEGKSAAIERQLLIDGKAPYAEADSILFQRVWANESDDVKRDNRGNDLRPQQKEKPQWQRTFVKDSQGYYVEPLSFYLNAGTHTVSLVSLREPLVIGAIAFRQAPAAKPYADVAAQYKADGLKPVAAGLVKVQGEKAARKSDPSLYPINDRTSPATEPYDVSNIRMNAIGGYNWRLPGQWIEWEIAAPEDGLYRLAFKSRQHYLHGLYSTRRLTVDDAVPFREAESLRFTYTNDWEMYELGDGHTPYYVHLTKGTHKIRLEASLGDIAPLLRNVESSILELNKLYRQIVQITGTVPDPYRDYHLDKQIPGLVDRFAGESKRLYAISGELVRLTGEKSDKVAVLNTTAYQLADFADRPDTIHKRLVSFRTNVGGLGTLMQTALEQPLDIDYVLLAGERDKLPKAQASFFAKARHEIVSFFYSFVQDYNSIGDVSGEGDSVTVWIGTGRDQAQVLKTMIDDTFTPQTGIKVNLKLVQMGMLLPATLANQGPDVAMQIGNETPVNFAMRGAAADVSKFPDFAEVAKRFRDSGLTPYRYRNNVYALPEQQTFGMLFYRKDILAELGLKVPQTWDDVYDMIPVLQKNNMQFELPLEQNFARLATMVPNPAYTALLLQAGGALYADGGRRTELDSEQSMQAFKRWTEFYTNYKMPLTFDFPNRFRAGEMPIGIADYTLYNHLSVSAPEIRGLWEFVPIPGTKAPDGTIRRDEASGGTAVMMLQNSQRKQSAWSFMKWWTDKETQVRFGREMEGLMGAAARYPTANIEALAELPWPVKDYRHLEEQWKWVQGIPEVPGGYFTGRHLDNAFRKVVNDNVNARETLTEYTRTINDEIALKRREFQLPD